MDNVNERKDVMLDKISDLKQARDAAEVLVKALEKEKSLPDSAKAAITAYGNKKKG